MINIIVACTKSGVIGKGNQLPWRLPEDLKLFREKTLGHNVVMGMNTWKSIPDTKRPLDKRCNIVLSRSTWYPPVSSEGPFIVGSFTAIFNAIRNNQEYAEKDVFIIGGAQIYGKALKDDIVDRVIMSRLIDEYEGDVYFPTLLEDKWGIKNMKHFEKFDLIEYARYGR